ncbi:hypothetical protein [Pedobacter steynii]
MKLFKLLSLVAIAGLLVTGSMTSRNHHLLFSDSAHAGILSLELTRSNSVQYQIFSEWNRPQNYVFVRDWTNPEDSIMVTDTMTPGSKAKYSEPGLKIKGVDAAERQTHADYWFILFYVFGLILLFWHYHHNIYPSKDRIKSWQFWLFWELWC